MRILIILMVLLIMPSTVFAQASSSTVASDQGAISKDNNALSRDQTALERDRSQKAADKESGNWSGQFVDSLAIGYDHVVGTEKSGETSTDKTILNHDTK